MSNLTLKIAAAVLALSTAAAHAAPAADTIIASSPVGWSVPGDHAVLMLRYSGNATQPLTITSEGVFDIGLGTSNAQVVSCGTPQFSGKVIVAYQISPGGLCLLQGGRSQYEVIGRFTANDGTGTPTGVATYVRATLETRDVNDNVLTHIDLR